ncbi:MAG: T9SS type A sorting domain-containing protein [Ignavibacteria bacterium]|nr:T9SS type A sorting domain-containing protein [Ignavibacteria bacterium]
MDNYILSGNYPNPFNPVTKINYELRISNYVTIKVYDVLGNEVATLINQKQNAGSYEIELNGSPCASLGGTGNREVIYPAAFIFIRFLLIMNS